MKSSVIQLPLDRAAFSPGHVVSPRKDGLAGAVGCKRGVLPVFPCAGRRVGTIDFVSSMINLSKENLLLRLPPGENVLTGLDERGRTHHAGADIPRRDIGTMKT